ncbi:MAG: FAD-dependent oxidoreductase [Lactobacillales bacterium]|jgi:NADPH-dependent 2,4-dienoyl-CoA reductase/sulfur reductase-like enzyme|nr:FAD-dependent oxidoreductase [Lactobacillales bacterium]
MKVVIIGGSHAGIACARRCREEHPDAQVVIIERKKDISFVSQTIPLFLIGEENILEEGHYATPAELESEGIEVLTKMEVKTIEVDRKRLTYANVDTGKLDEMFYDKLVMATGSYPVLPLINGVFNETFFLLKNVEDAVAIKKFMEKSHDVVIIGAGIVGVELSRIFAKKGLHVTVLQARENVMNRYLDVEMAKVVEKSIRDIGVDLYLNTRAIDYHTKKANAFHKSGVIVETDIGKKIKTSGVLLSVGFRPNSYLLRGQVKLGDKGAILVDEYMQTSVSDVFAVGDCASSYFNLLDMNRYNPHASEAIRQGVMAAINLFEPKQKLPCSLGTYNLKMPGYTVAVTGITKSVALNQGYDADAIYFENLHLDAKDFSYMQLIYEKKTHVILGFQVVGNTSINEYANVFSLVIQQKLTIEDIEFSDFYFEHGYKDPSGFTKIMARLTRKKEREVK